MSAKLLIRFALLAGCFLSLPLLAQPPAAQETAQQPLAWPAEVSWKVETLVPLEAHDFHAYLMPAVTQSYILVSAPLRADSALFDKLNWTYTPGTIQRMESAVYCNDTPFVDQVRFPLATLWRGHVKLTGFESDVTTANFVLGLPGQGALHSLNAFGNAFIATHTPPSDQLAGIHMTFSWHAASEDAFENSGLHGIQYLVRASRNALPFRNPQHSDAARSAAR